MLFLNHYNGGKKHAICAYMMCNVARVRIAQDERPPLLWLLLSPRAHRNDGLLMGVVFHLLAP